MQCITTLGRRKQRGFVSENSYSNATGWGNNISAPSL